MRSFAVSLGAWFLPILASLVFTVPVCAQVDDPRDYARIPIDPNFKKLLENRLQMERDLGALKDLIKQIVADPSKFPIDKEQLKNLKLDDPKVQNALKDWASNDPQMKKALQEWAQKNPPGNQPAKVKNFQQNLKKIIDEAPPKADPVFNNGIDPPLPPRPADPPKPKADPIAKATENAMKQAENSKIGDWLRDSPAWNKAVKDLQESINNPDAPRFDLAAWKEKFNFEDGKAWKLGAGPVDRLGELPRPDLGRALPAIGLPRLTAPQLPDVSGPMLPTFSAGVVWLLLFILFLLGAWLILRWSRQNPRSDGHDETPLGPWPVRPENVSTRRELVQAFDYLAVLTLGRGVQSWNHHAVARQWNEKAPQCAPQADALAAIYEEARYTEGAEELSEAQRDQARRSLVQLTEALG
ncbi:MAG: DUF4129 domain-containing protein [Planctomycetes bacterium]|nr:DUF4129 domain-containing protein [Planctomycetota bacterium]